MRRLKPKEVILLALPILMFVTYAMWIQSTSSPMLSLGEVRVVRIPPQQRDKKNLLAPDTQLNITVRLRKRTPWGELMEDMRFYRKSNIGKSDVTYLMDASGTKYVMDASGKNYFASKNSKGAVIVPFTHTGSVEQPLEDTHINFPHIWKFQLSQIPASAGTVAFHTNYANGDNSELPVKVVVRP